MEKTEKLLLTPTETAEKISCGRTRVYQMLSSHELPSVRLGRSIRVPVKGLQEWIEKQQAANALTLDGGN